MQITHIIFHNFVDKAQIFYHIKIFKKLLFLCAFNLYTYENVRASEIKFQSTIYFHNIQRYKDYV